MGIGAVVLATWGEWPAWQTLTAGGGIIANLQLLQFIALKSSLFIDVETVLLGLTIVLFGQRFHAGWKTHIQRIAIGLGVVSLAQIASEAAVQILARTGHPHSQEEYQHLMNLRDWIFYANSAVLVLAIIWWIACLWKDEPGASETGVAVPVAANPPLQSSGATVLPPE
jgi:uncharacterized membrane protein